MLYHITDLCPAYEPDGVKMGGCGFCIQLFPAWKEAWERYMWGDPERKMDQSAADFIIKRMHRLWLDGCGYSRMMDPDVDPMDEWKEKKLGTKIKLGPKAYHLYDERSIRVSWGEWGPEHITVPGDACGLDISSSGLGAPPGGRVLCPHNVDQIRQAHLLLVVFIYFADHIVSKQISDSYK